MAIRRTISVVTIYGLFDPIDGSLRYIGKTRGSLSKRLSDHKGKATNVRMRAWIEELKSRGYAPRIEKLSACARVDSARAERAAILRYSTDELLNQQLRQ